MSTVLGHDEDEPARYIACGESGSAPVPAVAWTTGRHVYAGAPPLEREMMLRSKIECPCRRVQSSG